MEINFAETKAIADTLPIGLYAKRRVPVSMSDKEATSYYNPVTDEIVISYPIIAKGLAKVAEDAYKETAIRSMQYHELAHAILTPDRLTMTDWMNTFEDERIETLLNGYFLDTDFKKQVLTINGYSALSEVSAPSSPFEYFYNIVRFGIGEKKYVDRVTEIINQYAKLNKNTEYWDVCGAYNYYRDVRAFYEEVVRDFDPSKAGSGSSSATMDKVGGKSGSKSSGDGSPTDGDGSAPADGKDGEEASSAMDGNPCHGTGRPSPLSDADIEAIMESVFTSNPYVNTSLTQKMSMIIDNFSKRNNSGSSMNAYSGVFNPRAVARRDDYKYWDKPSTVNGANRFGTLHLNLFIDKSGSFCSSEVPMNQLLRSLTEIESKNKNFTFDVVFCGMGERLVTSKRDRVFKASGGNHLDAKVCDIFKKLQKPNTFNYNIACFDGDACSDGGRNEHGFSAFDNATSTIITDSSNEKYIRHDVHNAKVIYTDNYAEELIDNVIAILSKAFR